MRVRIYIRSDWLSAGRSFFLCDGLLAVKFIGAKCDGKFVCLKKCS